MIDEILVQQCQDQYEREMEARLLVKELSKQLRAERPTMRKRILLALGNFLITLSQKVS